MGLVCSDCFQIDPNMVHCTNKCHPDERERHIEYHRRVKELRRAHPSHRYPPNRYVNHTNVERPPPYNPAVV